MKTREPLARPIAWSLAALVAALALFALGAGSEPAAQPAEIPALPPPSNGAISPQNQADALHYVVAADRELYGRAYAARQAVGAPAVDSAADAAHAPWPSPCELFRRAAESIQSKGAEFSYALRSLDPIDARNGPQTELEQKGLAFVAANPGQNYYGPEMLGGRRYITAVYADLPATASCIDCHRRRSPAHAERYRLGQPMGGVVVRVPLEF